MSMLRAGFRALILRFGGNENWREAESLPASACWLGAGIGLLLGCIILTAGMAALFPFLSDYQAVFGAPVILLASFGVMFLLGILKSMPWSRFKISLNAYANGLSAVVLAQAVLLTCLFAAFHICETQEIVLIALVVVLLFGLMWQAIISNSVFIHVLRMPVGLSAVVAGGIALIGLVTGLYIWYQWIAADVLTWDYSFFT